MPSNPVKNNARNSSPHPKRRRSHRRRGGGGNQRPPPRLRTQIVPTPPAPEAPALAPEAPAPALAPEALALAPEAPALAPEAPAPAPAPDPSFTPVKPNWPKRIPRIPRQPCPQTWQLLVQWPPSRGYPRLKFEIHGAYPRYRFTPRKLIQCKHEAFPDSIGRKLFPIWSNLKHDNATYEASIRLWKHEYNKHGRYSGLSIRDYFLLVCAMYYRLPDIRVLGPLGIKKSHLEDIRQSIRDCIGSEVEIKAIKYEEKLYLLEIGFEMYPQTGEFADSPFTSSGDITRQTYYIRIPSAEDPLPRDAMANH